MPPKQIEALKLALEALELLTGAWQTFDALDYGDNAITAIKEVLAEHAMREVQRLGQEIEPKIGCVNHDCDQCKAQPEQEPVKYSDYEPDGVHHNKPEQDTVQRLSALVRAQQITIDKLEAQRTEQEPVAWMDKYGEIYKDVPEVLSTDKPLYTAPPQRKPLTHELREEIVFRWRYVNGCSASELISMVEAAHGIKGDA